MRCFTEKLKPETARRILSVVTVPLVLYVTQLLDLVLIILQVITAAATAGVSAATANADCSRRSEKVLVSTRQEITATTVDDGGCDCDCG